MSRQRRIPGVGPGRMLHQREKESVKTREAVRPAFDVMATEKGARVAFSKLLSEETLNARAQSMRVPDWVLVLLKLKSRISDKGWQDFTNLTKLGRRGVRDSLFYILHCT